MRVNHATEFEPHKFQLVQKKYFKRPRHRWKFPDCVVKTCVLSIKNEIHNFYHDFTDLMSFLSTISKKYLSHDEKHELSRHSLFLTFSAENFIFSLHFVKFYFFINRKPQWCDTFHDFLRKTSFFKFFL